MSDSLLTAETAVGGHCRQSVWRWHLLFAGVLHNAQQAGQTAVAVVTDDEPQRWFLLSSHWLFLWCSN
jgi:hypothetical protein